MNSILNYLKKARNKLYFLALALFFSIPNVVWANEGLKGLEEEYETNWDAVWGILRPALRIGAIVIAVLGVAVLVFTIYNVVVWTAIMLMGKGKFGKAELKKAAIGIVVGLLVTGGGWMGFLQLGQKVIIEPGQEIINQEDTSSNQSNNN